MTLSSKSAATRARIVLAAERLYAERGIDAVSLLEISQAAGQRNKNAAQYHFGSKQGLIQAIIDKHLPAILLQRDRELDRLSARGDITLRKAVGAILQPLADKLVDPDGGAAFIRINAQLASTHAAALNRDGRAAAYRIGPLDRLDALRGKVLGKLPEAIAKRRILLGVLLLFDGLSDLSKKISAGELNRRVDIELAIRDLEDALVGLMSAPVSRETNEALSAMAMDQNT